MNAPHGIIEVGRRYANGGRSTTNPQDRRIIQEIFRDLAQHVEGVDIEMLVESLKDGLAEEGIHSGEMTNLLKFYDGVRASLVSAPDNFRPLQVGDRVRCPSQKALGTGHLGDIWSGEVGTVIVNQYDDGDIHVQWHGVSLFHHAEELVRVSNAVPNGVRAQAIDLMRRSQKIEAIKVVREATSMGLKEAKDYVEALPLAATGTTVSLADSGLVPSIINQAKRDSYGLTTAQDRELVRALLDSPVVRASVLNFDNEDFHDARRAIADVLTVEPIFESEARTLVQAYEDALDPRAAEKRELRAELERAEALAAELRRKLAA